ncbi:MAG: TRAP transporter fused permease subunit [Rhodospirillales bacterium]|jgi:TRAP transporter 4TM/12TM fusion protein|nr:TRAP transporter fused permease subunit [Rhodospirillales bacterium]
MDRITQLFLKACLGLIPIIGIGWIFAVPDRVGYALTFQQVVVVLLGLAISAAFLKYPYRDKAGLLEIVLGLAAIGSWFWMSWNFEAWIVLMADRTPDMWGPGVGAIVLMMEGTRKAAGKIIAGLVWVIILYAFFGDLMPGPLEAEVFPPTKVVLYLYADNNGIPGLVLRVVSQLVLAFILFGKLLEISGGSAFFNDLALGWMGHRRGGPAKVAVVASSAFGTISGSTVGNIMSTGVVTIPLMKKSGFQAKYAAAIEAVASNGGQIAPPIMGATAFIIAEFLEVPYQDVVIAAAVPAILYYLVLFLQVDAIAARFGLKGLPKSELPEPWRVFISGWVYLLPIVVLLYYLFGLGFNPGLSAMYATTALLVLMVLKNRRLPSRENWSNFIFGGGENLVPLILISGAAGVVIGVLNATGLAFQLSLLLTTVGQNAGILAMLAITAVIAIILGMGMPTAAVYIVLVTVVAPALIEMGLTPMAAHLFLFYFGLVSMLTPPVAVASMVAAGLAGSDMWRTGLVGVQLAIAAYLLPFLWAFNPALIFEGSNTAIILAFVSAAVAGWMLARALQDFSAATPLGVIWASLLLVGALAIGSSSVWLDPESIWVGGVSAAGVALLLYLRNREKARPLQPQSAG